MTQEKLSKKDATHEISIILGEIDVSNEKLKDIKDKLKEDYGREEAEIILTYARLAHKDKVEEQLERNSKIAELDEEING